MAIKNIIAYGIGFSPGSTKWLPTLGFSSGTVIPPTPSGVDDGYAKRIGRLRAFSLTPSRWGSRRTDPLN